MTEVEVAAGKNNDAQRGRELGLGIRAADVTCRAEKMGRCDDDADTHFRQEEEGGEEENSRRRVYCSKMPTPVAKGESISAVYILHTPFYARAQPGGVSINSLYKTLF